MLTWKNMPRQKLLDHKNRVTKTRFIGQIKFFRLEMLVNDIVW